MAGGYTEAALQLLTMCCRSCFLGAPHLRPKRRDITPTPSDQPIELQFLAARVNLIPGFCLDWLALCGIGRQLLSVTGPGAQRAPLLLQVAPAWNAQARGAEAARHRVPPPRRAPFAPPPGSPRAAAIVTPHSNSKRPAVRRRLRSLGRAVWIGRRRSQWRSVSKAPAAPAFRSACSNNMAAAAIGRVRS